MRTIIVAVLAFVLLAVTPVQAALNFGTVYQRGHVTFQMEKIENPFVGVKVKVKTTDVTVREFRVTVAIRLTSGQTYLRTVTKEIYWSPNQEWTEFYFSPWVMEDVLGVTVEEVFTPRMEEFH